MSENLAREAAIKAYAQRIAYIEGDINQVPGILQELWDTALAAQGERLKRLEGELAAEREATEAYYKHVAERATAADTALRAESRGGQ